jgi:peptidyl-prolyl cis-trans isomerase A (cyclophilin A)
MIRLRDLLVAAMMLGTSGVGAQPSRALLLNPAAAFWSARAPDSAVIELTTSKGVIAIMLYRAWAPAGVDRVYNLARGGFFDDSRFYRVVATYIAQFGLAGDPVIAQRWRSRRLKADSVRTTNARGTLTFAQTSPRDRSTDLFINLRDNPKLDTLGFAPVGRVIEGMEVADALFFGYGDLPSSAPPLGNPRRFYGEANRYLDKEYPKLERILTARVR